MIDIERLDIDKNYKEILKDYKFHLIHEEHLEEKTTCNSYLYDVNSHAEEMFETLITKMQTQNQASETDKLLKVNVQMLMVDLINLITLISQTLKVTNLGLAVFLMQIKWMQAL